MSALKSFVTPVGLSMALHGVLAAALVGAPLAGHSTAGQPIQIDYVEYEKIVVKAPAAVKSKTTASASSVNTSKKKTRGIPVPALNERAKREAADSELQKVLREKMKNQEAVLSRLSSEEAKSAERSRPRTSAEMLADPQKGKIFVSYFSEVKRKIQETLHARYARKYSGQGNVTLLFVLNAEGRLEKVVVADQESVWDPTLRDLAMQCLREAAPFGAFPQDLGKGRIAFNLTVYFEGF